VPTKSEIGFYRLEINYKKIIKIMQCNHVVSFIEKSGQLDGVGHRYFWNVGAVCPECQMLNDEGLKEALANSYSPNLVDLIYRAYLSKKEYFRLSSQISSAGVNHFLLPKIENDSN